MNLTPEASDTDTILLIARRANAIVERLGYEPRGVVQYAMDIAATHLNGNPLDLDALLAADLETFAHDVFGIERHLSRTTGKLGDCFSPRTSLTIH